MSAWIVEKAHIDCLVQSMVVEKIISPDEADATGQMLWHENYLSIEARYGDEPNTPEYHFEGIEAPLDDAIVKQQIDCYDYQSCEHAAFTSSKAYALCDQLTAILIARNGGDAQFEDKIAAQRGVRLPWGIKALVEAVA